VSVGFTMMLGNSRRPWPPASARHGSGVDSRQVSADHRPGGGVGGGSSRYICDTFGQSFSRYVIVIVLL